MRFIVLRAADAQTEAGAMPSEALMQAGGLRGIRPECELADSGDSPELERHARVFAEVDRQSTP